MNSDQSMEMVTLPRMDPVEPLFPKEGGQETVEDSGVGESFSSSLLTGSYSGRAVSIPQSVSEEQAIHNAHAADTAQFDELSLDFSIPSGPYCRRPENFDGSLPLRDESDESTAKDYNGRRNGVQNDGEKVESVLVQVDETVNTRVQTQREISTQTEEDAIEKIEIEQCCSGGDDAEEEAQISDEKLAPSNQTNILNQESAKFDLIQDIEVHLDTNGDSPTSSSTPMKGYMTRDISKLTLNGLSVTDENQLQSITGNSFVKESLNPQNIILDGELEQDEDDTTVHRARAAEEQQKILNIPMCTGNADICDNNVNNTCSKEKNIEYKNIANIISSMVTAINLEADGLLSLEHQASQPNSVDNFGKPDQDSIVPRDAVNDEMQHGDLDGSNMDEPTIDQSLLGAQGDRFVPKVEEDDGICDDPPVSMSQIVKPGIPLIKKMNAMVTDPLPHGTAEEEANEGVSKKQPAQLTPTVQPALLDSQASSGLCNALISESKTFPVSTESESDNRFMTEEQNLGSQVFLKSTLNGNSKPFARSTFLKDQERLQEVMDCQLKRDTSEALRMRKCATDQPTQECRAKYSKLAFADDKNNRKLLLLESCTSSPKQNLPGIKDERKSRNATNSPSSDSQLPLSINGCSTEHDIGTLDKPESLQTHGNDQTPPMHHKDTTNILNRSPINLMRSPNRSLALSEKYMATFDAQSYLTCTAQPHHHLSTPHSTDQVCFQEDNLPKRKTHTETFFLTDQMEAGSVNDEQLDSATSEAQCVREPITDSRLSNAWMTQSFDIPSEHQDEKASLISQAKSQGVNENNNARQPSGKIPSFQIKTTKIQPTPQPTEKTQLWENEASVIPGPVTTCERERVKTDKKPKVHQQHNDTLINSKSAIEPLLTQKNTDTSPTPLPEQNKKTKLIEIDTSLPAETVTAYERENATVDQQPEIDEGNQETSKISKTADKPWMSIDIPFTEAKPSPQEPAPAKQFMSKPEEHSEEKPANHQRQQVCTDSSLSLATTEDDKVLTDQQEHSKHPIASGGSIQTSPDVRPKTNIPFSSNAQKSLKRPSRANAKDPEVCNSEISRATTKNQKVPSPSAENKYNKPLRSRSRSLQHLPEVPDHVFYVSPMAHLPTNAQKTWKTSNRRKDLRAYIGDVTQRTSRTDRDQCASIKSNTSLNKLRKVSPNKSLDTTEKESPTHTTCTSLTQTSQQDTNDQALKVGYFVPADALCMHSMIHDASMINMLCQVIIATMLLVFRIEDDGWYTTAEEFALTLGPATNSEIVELLTRARTVQPNHGPAEEHHVQRQGDLPIPSYDYIHEIITDTALLPTGDFERPVSPQSECSEENNVAGYLSDSD